jgi:DNA-binding transcriptional ArsR family regulator
VPACVSEVTPDSVGALIEICQSLYSDQPLRWVSMTTEAVTGPVPDPRPGPAPAPARRADLGGRRIATDAEARALASGLRLRILRLCLDASLTNKEIAAALGKDPASVLYHVRKLVDTGFLTAEPVRRGSRGSRERPYRATGKSWTTTVIDPVAHRAGTVAMLDALQDEARAVEHEDVLITRLGVRLTEDERMELHQRFETLFEEYRQRPASPGAKPYSTFFVDIPERRPLETPVPSVEPRDTIEDDD